ncbi:beta-glucosidase 47 [Vigna radiata var. radiata]|uniref:Beta-glucosidase 47 n=1 Tax=Vigna radiata var. radiata TaxID=3916 RepID=A0A1S3VKM5_VIGRR|nr:beta-glucosidase 47 [Vigna radiata var. radiata]
MEAPLLPLFALFFSFSILFLSSAVSHSLSLKEDSNSSPFPPNFLFGTASSSYQIEGAYLADGKGLNNWDVFTHKPGTVADGSNGDVADDHYHRYKEDVDLMEDLGVNSYRMSLSWTRILPKGRFGKVNQAGIDYYNRLINLLLSRGIEPFVTISHYDIPQEAVDRYDGWLSPEIAKDFTYYADICFKNFGDRVKYWITFNEPNVAFIRGYRIGIWPPGRCSGSFGNCSVGGNSEKEPFIVGHNFLLAHGSIVELYRTKYQKIQGGKIGLASHTMWFEPISNSTEDKMALERAQAFYMNWFLDPAIRGDYPIEMREILGDDLPPVPEILKRIKPSIDFIGVNHYTSYFVKDCLHSVCEPLLGSTRTEGSALTWAHVDGRTIGKPTSLDWLFIYPQGMENIVTYIWERFKIPIFVTENGVGWKEGPNLTIQEMINDEDRIDYVRAYLDALVSAIRKGADVRGYFLWSLLDNFEWTDGSSIRFGLHRVDYDTLERTPRMSASWYKNFIALHGFGPGAKPLHTQE